MKGFSHDIFQALPGTLALTGEWNLFAKLMVLVALFFLALTVFVRFGLRGKTVRNPAWRPILHYCFLHGLIFGGVGLLLGFFRFEQVLYLAAPWIFDLYLLIVLFWLAWMGRLLLSVPAVLEEQKEIERKQQWIKARPKRRKKRR